MGGGIREKPFLLSQQLSVCVCLVKPGQWSSSNQMEQRIFQAPLKSIYCKSTRLQMTILHSGGVHFLVVVMLYSATTLLCS